MDLRFVYLDPFLEFKNPLSAYQRFMYLLFQLNAARSGYDELIRKIQIIKPFEK